MSVPNLHICGVAGIADIEGIKQQYRVQIARCQPGNNPVQPIKPHSIQIGRSQPSCRPFVKRQIRWPNLNPVVVIR